jgi:hypothetical protein
MALTDFDEKVPKFEAAYPINKIARGDIDMDKFRRLVYKIRQRYPLSSRPEFYSEIGKKGGETRAQDKEGLSEAGRKGGQH